MFQRPNPVTFLPAFSAVTLEEMPEPVVSTTCPIRRLEEQVLKSKKWKPLWCLHTWLLCSHKPSMWDALGSHHNPDLSARPIAQHHHLDEQKKVGCRHRIGSKLWQKRVLVCFRGILAASAQLEGQCETNYCRMSSQRWKPGSSEASKIRHAVQKPQYPKTSLWKHQSYDL